MPELRLRAVAMATFRATDRRWWVRQLGERVHTWPAEQPEVCLCDKHHFNMDTWTHTSYGFITSTNCWANDELLSHVRMSHRSYLLLQHVQPLAVGYKSNMHYRKQPSALILKRNYRKYSIALELSSFSKCECIHCRTPLTSDNCIAVMSI